MKKFFKVIFGRMLYITLFVTIQIAALVVMFLFFKDKFAYFYVVCILLSIVATMVVLNSTSNPAYKIAWVIPILLFPIFGGLLYLLFGNIHFSKREKASAQAMLQQVKTAMAAVPNGLAPLKALNPEAELHAHYIQNATSMTLHGHTQTEYFPLGEALYAKMLQELNAAKSFIFLEYFIIEEGTMWGGILEILERKVQEGVDVRVMYDDVGSLFKVPRKYSATLRKKGINACVFNPFNSILSSRFNNRDHRKICVIDGNVGFTGGINLADEYINVTSKLGHWKDGGICLRGEGVWSLTVMFLSMWDFVRGQKDDFGEFAPNPRLVSDTPDDGFVQLYSDMPLDEEAVGESVYLNLINRAQRYIYIMTPYLIIDNELVTALRTAAKSGVDVRIITPFIPDKPPVQLLTRSYYETLLSAGVKIYEYTPGFIHAKNVVCDDIYGVIGTINLDYRSLYLHFECAAWLYRSKAVAQLRADFEATLPLCKEITLDSVQRLPLYKKLFLTLLRVFAPLM